MVICLYHLTNIFNMKQNVGGVICGSGYGDIMGGTSLLKYRFSKEMRHQSFFHGGVAKF